VALAAGDVLVRVHGSALGAHPGAEAAGEIIEAGDAAAQWLGHQVVVPRLLPCGECGACQRGRVAACPHRRRRGSPAAAETVPARSLLPLVPPLFPKAVPAGSLWRWAALADALSAPYAGLCRAGVSPGELCAVMGDGPRLAAAVLVAQALGLRTAVLCADGETRERLCAPPYQVLQALDSARLDPGDARAALDELAAREGLAGLGLTVLEVSGSDAGRVRALAMAPAAAVLLDRPGEVSGLPAPLPPSLALPLSRLCQEQGQVIGAGPAHPDLLPELAARVLRGEIDLAAFTYAVAPHEIDDVLSRRRRGQGDRLGLPIVCF
jgi:threonine dehydrogenase-like Zn-dependent dehydrogenase